MKPATPLHEILEDDWDRTLFRGPKSLAVQLGWTSYHTLRSKGSKSGYPDPTLVRERIVFAELKREKTQPTPDQVAWLDKLAAGGGEVYLLRPSHLEEFARVLTHRGRPDWVPACAWRPDLWHVNPACWIWPRAKTNRGYGNHGGQVAHRVTYETFREPIPDGFDLHHVCGNRACVNPWHLTALPHDEHASLHSAGKEFCAQGHPFDADNTWVDARGHRHCRTCRREVNRRWRSRSAGATTEQQSLSQEGVAAA